MQALRTIGRGALALVVEDARLTAALALWIVLTAVLSRWGGFDGLLGGLALFAGCALILIENLIHSARHSR